MMAFKTDQWKKNFTYIYKSDVNSQHQNRTGFYGHKTLVEQSKSEKERKGFFKREADSGIYFGVHCKQTHQDWVIMENIIVCTNISTWTASSFSLSLLLTSEISLFSISKTYKIWLKIGRGLLIVQSHTYIFYVSTTPTICQWIFAWLSVSQCVRARAHSFNRINYISPTLISTSFHVVFFLFSVCVYSSYLRC